MISCSDFLAEIGNYLEGDAAAEVRAQLERHLAICKVCTVLVDSTSKTIHVVTDSESFDLPQESLKPLASGIMDHIRFAQAD